MEKKKPGQPSKYETIDLKKVEKLAEYGLTEPQIAAILNISPATVKNYKKNPEFLAALKSGKEKADSKVIKSLYRRAVGYKHRDTYFSNYKGEVSATPYTKHYPPDSIACFFWLKNRQRTNWTNADNGIADLSEEQIGALRSLADKAMEESV